ncbi:MAG: molybdopterin converting factor subunit 1 [Planctomycetaceae bacterium]|nr:molybdopterin converting factor subunit 1 [Planctomycetaceae bacterium]
MKLTVQLFAVVRDLAGAPAVEIEVPEQATIGQVRTILAEHVPALTSLQKHCHFAVNADYATDATVVPDGADVACIPPVSGG